MGLGGVACPKPESRKRIKGRKDRAKAKVRKAVRKIRVSDAGECCERCGRWCGEDGHAHHRIPRSRGGEWTVENIQYICADCHETAHRTNTL